MKERARILVGALSCRKAPERRQACRDTWWADLKAANVPAFFLLGDESIVAPRQDGDELTLPCPDDYDSLPQKTRGWCRFALERYDFDYLYKCDDDTYVCVPRFLAYDQKGKDYIGIDPVENGKPFNSGGAGYLLSRRAVELVAEQLTAAKGLEDVLVGDIMRGNGVERTQEPKFQAWRFPQTIPSPTNDGISVHYIRGLQMRLIHESLRQT